MGFPSLIKPHTGDGTMTLVELYSKEDCHLCDEAQAVLEKVQAEIPFTLKVYKLIAGEAFYDEYKEDFPVVHINKRMAFKHRIHEHGFKIRLQQISKAEDGDAGDTDDDSDMEISR